TLAALAERAGLARRAAGGLASAGRGRTCRLYALVCLTSAGLTGLVSLDGLVVLMVPLVRALAQRCRIAQAPFFLGAVAVANAVSLDRLAPALSLRGGGLAALLAVAGGTAAAAAAANNLPVSASVAALATSGPGAYAALIGLSVGALATAHGSVATLIARDLAGDSRPWARTWAAPTV